MCDEAHLHLDSARRILHVAQDGSAPPELAALEGRYRAGIDKVRFRKPVVPGDQLIYEMEVLKHKGKIWKMAGKALVDDKVVAEAELMAAFA